MADEYFCGRPVPRLILLIDRMLNNKNDKIEGDRCQSFRELT